jgi:hypothetical protein
MKLVLEYYTQSIALSKGKLIECLAKVWFETSVQVA